MSIMLDILNRVSVDLACKNSGFDDELRARDWLLPWRARRKLLTYRDAYARLWARELRRRQGLPPESENPDADLMMAGLTVIVRRDELPEGATAVPISE